MKSLPLPRGRSSVKNFLKDIIIVIGEDTKSHEARQRLLRHVTLIQVESQAGSLIEKDRQYIQLRSEALKLKLKGQVLKVGQS